MKRFLLISMSIFSAVSNAGYLDIDELMGVNDKVIYEQDDRVDVESTQNKMFKKLSKSVAVLIHKDELSPLTKNGVAGFKLTSKPLYQDDNICKDQKFSFQPSHGACTGFLVSEDKLVTAGHCIGRTYGSSTVKCSPHYVWVFDYTLKNAQAGFIPKENVFSCGELLLREINLSSYMDYAFIKLDRKTGREGLKFRQDGEIKKGTDIFTIGSPSGLPLKVAGNAEVKSNNSESPIFKANLDSFGGNSGSPVFNSETFEVEGLLTYGERDYFFDYKKECYVVNRCSSSDYGGNYCGGENVTKISRLKLQYEL